ncbi:MAG: flavodoxin domain-containing protein [Anaerolineales bacterium]|nr:flavodoxin domain-containing protein [Anaerolineales bacterium]
MNIVIIYDSSTGTTAKAAQAMGKTFEDQGHTCRVQSVAKADPADVLEADLICVGSWVKGLFFIRQHPTEGTMRFIERSGALSGKNTIVFCTYKTAVGSALRQMAKTLEGKGAKVVGQFKYRGPKPNNKFASFAASLT